MGVRGERGRERGGGNGEWRERWRPEGILRRDCGNYQAITVKEKKAPVKNKNRGRIAGL